jgi:3-oxoacyl-[acyl-carrier-protein] synthase III
MIAKSALDHSTTAGSSFYLHPNVQVGSVAVAGGVPWGIERVFNPEVGIGGAYGTWGESFDNQALYPWIEQRLGEPLHDDEKMDLSSLGFTSRHHTPILTEGEHQDLEVQVGARILVEAARANGWEPGEVEGVLIGMSGPVCIDYIERIARLAGIPNQALKVSVHKACDGSMGALNLALNPGLAREKAMRTNIAEELYGKKIMVGGIEGLSRFTNDSRDKNGLQLFGNGAGVIGVIPGKTMNFLVGKDHEAFDEEGVLAVRMYYPHSRERTPGGSMVEISETGDRHVRVAGLMHEPQDGSALSMAGMMGMVKLFVRNGVDVVREVYQDYKNLMARWNMPHKDIRVSIVHHANYKINQLKAKNLHKAGIPLDMPWLLSEFGNISAASNIIAFLRQLPELLPGDHILFDGFGAGTYYDVIAVALAEGTG